MIASVRLNAAIPVEQAGRRFDQALADMFPQYSRSRLQQWIRQGAVTLDGQLASPKYRVAGGERVVIDAEMPVEGEVAAEDIPLDIRFSDEHLLVVNKPPGLVVHPAAGNRAGTLQNALLFLDPALAAVPRAGIVHRLDKDTSGLMVVARTLEAHHSLVAQLQARSVHREYLAVVQSVLTAGGSVDLPIGRHPVDRLRMAVSASGKSALTHYRVLDRYSGHSLIEVRLETGRTHQIRVHMAHLHYPLVGDPLYGGRPRLPRGASERLRETVMAFPRQALHARRLEVLHPQSGSAVAWEAETPPDLQALIDVLESER